MTASKGSVVVWALIGGASPQIAAASALGESVESRVAWGVAIMAVVAAAVLAWRNNNLHRKLETGMSDMKELVRGLNERFTDQTEALEHASEQLESQRQTIEELRLTDPVTGLWTRQHVGQVLAGPAAQAVRTWVAWNKGAVLSRPENADLLCFMVGLDSLEEASTTLGPEVGEAVMREFADTLRATSRSTDVLARWGSGEFLVVRASADRRSARELAERLLESVSSHVFHPRSGLEFSTTCSVGFGCHPFLTHDPETLGWENVVSLAEEALQVAKRTGRNEWVGLIGGPSTPTDDLAKVLQTGPESLVARDRITALTSFPEDVELKWQDDEQPNPA